MVDKVLPSPILPQVTPRTIEGVILTQGLMTRQLLDVIREHARAINQIIDYLNGFDAGWLTYTPTITAASGTITTLGTVVGRYKMLGANTVLVYLDISITTNGTGAGNMQATLPFTPAITSVGVGRVMTGGPPGYAGFVLSITTGTPAGILNYDNTYPGADGTRLICSVIYPLA